MKLAALRQDLGVFQASPEHDGSPAWNIHDPVSNRFYRINWAIFEVLSRWHLGSSQAVLTRIQQETTLQLHNEDIEGVVQFLEAHHLLLQSTAEHSAQLLTRYQQQKLHWGKWLLKNYLFFRIPLFHPDSLLQRLTPKLSGLFTSGCWWLLLLITMLTIVQVFRHWEDFSHSFAAYHNWEALLAFALAITFSKILHELGHAVAATHYGCRIPSMGVAFLVLWPMLYTDTTDSWKLASRRARLQIGAAGMAAELMLALLATWLWFMLPDGPLRAAVFFLATGTWVITLIINISPFMRFDGYFLLSDLLNIPNLHQRAFALGRWWLREKLFALQHPSPEFFTPGLHRFLIIFAVVTWIYRLILFLSIALLVYHFFFKALGIFLMIVELIWFIARPIYQELSLWFKLRSQLSWNSTTMRNMLLLMLLMFTLIIPWQTRLTVPAVISPLQEQSLYAPVSSRIEYLNPANRVNKGDILLQLNSPELTQRIQLARLQTEQLRWQLEQQAFSSRLLAKGEALREHYQASQSRLDGLLAEQQKLTLRAPFDGRMLIDRDEYQHGSWVTPQLPLVTLINPELSKIEAYVSEEDLNRLQPRAQARFIADQIELGRYDCRVAEIDNVNVSQLQEPAITSLYGGTLPARWDNSGQVPTLKPAVSSYRVLLEQCDPKQPPSMRMRGQATLEVEAESYIQQWTRQLIRVFVKEGGF